MFGIVAKGGAAAVALLPVEGDGLRLERPGFQQDFRAPVCRRGRFQQGQTVPPVPDAGQGVGVGKAERTVPGLAQVSLASTDKFFLVVESNDPKFDRHATTEFLRGLGAKGVYDVEE